MSLISVSFLCIIACVSPGYALPDTVNQTAPVSDPHVLVWGWVWNGNSRGTFDILSTCVFTTFLCTWTALHLNIPAPDESYHAGCFRKLRWMVQGLVGPEFVLYFAVGQRYEAKMSVEAFTKDGYDSWTMCHAFYANMGGFVLYPRDDMHFPVTARQLHYLVVNNFVPYPMLDKKTVQDKSKADGFAKALTSLQIIWLLLQLSARLWQRLPITTLELTTLTYVICGLGCFWQWAQKPLDVATATPIMCEKSIQEILDGESDEDDQLSTVRSRVPYTQLNPLDFVDNGSPSWTFNVQPFLGFDFGKREFPVQRFANDRFPMIGLGREVALYMLFTLAFFAIHAAAWNFTFPTRTERLIWRIATCAIAGSMFVIWIAEGIQDFHRYRRWRRLFSRFFGKVTELRDREEAMMAADFIPAWEFWVFVPATAVYFTARAFVLVEMFVSLRAQPTAVYDDIQWQTFVPHI
jgi:hypothetical protein